MAVSIGPDNPLKPFFIRRGRTSAADSPAAALGRLLTGMQADDASSFTGGFLEYDIAEVPPDQCPEPAVFLSLRPEVAPSCSAANEIYNERYAPAFASLFIEHPL